MRPERHSEIWRSEAGSRLWLSGLIAAMEQASQPEFRRQPVAPEILANFRVQLALAATFPLPLISTARH